MIFSLAALCAWRRDFASASNATLIGFAVVIALGIAQALQPCSLTEPAGYLPFTAAQPQTLYALLWWCAMAALLWSTCGILRWEGASRRLAVALFISGIVLAVVGILQRGLGNTFYYGGLRPIYVGHNPFGPFTNYNHAANWLAATACVGMGLLAERFHSPAQRRVPFSERIAQAVLGMFAVLVVAAALAGTGSRGAIHALCISGFVTALVLLRPLQGGRSRPLVLWGLAVAAGVYAVFLGVNPRYTGVIDGVLEGSVAWRVAMYKAGLRMFADFPVFGVGLGAFQSSYHAYQSYVVLGLVDHIHSSWFEIALETGIFGFLAFAAAAAVPLVTLGARLARREGASRLRPAAWFAAVLVLLLHGLVEFSFQIPANAVLLVVALAAATLSADIEVPLVPAGRRPVFAVVFAILAILSLPPGVDGAGPRLHAPFGQDDEGAWAAPDRSAQGLDAALAGLRRSPLSPHLRQAVGFELWKTGRLRDAQMFLDDSRKVR